MPFGGASGRNGKGDEPETMSHSILKQVNGLCIFTQDEKPGDLLVRTGIFVHAGMGSGCRLQMGGDRPVKYQ